MLTHLSLIIDVLFEVGDRLTVRTSIWHLYMSRQCHETIRFTVVKRSISTEQLMSTCRYVLRCLYCPAGKCHIWEFSSKDLSNQRSLVSLAGFDPDSAQKPHWDGIVVVSLLSVDTPNPTLASLPPLTRCFYVLPPLIHNGMSHAPKHSLLCVLMFYIQQSFCLFFFLHDLLPSH